MAEAGDGSGHTPLTPEWTPAPRASHYPWQGDRPAAAPSSVTVSALLMGDQTNAVWRLVRGIGSRNMALVGCSALLGQQHIRPKLNIGN